MTWGRHLLHRTSRAIGLLWPGEGAWVTINAEVDPHIGKVVLAIYQDSRRSLTCYSVQKRSTRSG
jgi:hypothetical protein